MVFILTYQYFSEQPSKAAIVLRHAALERDKRCVLAYIYHRYGHKLNIYLFPLCKKSLICLKGKSMTPP